MLSSRYATINVLPQHVKECLFCTEGSYYEDDAIENGCHREWKVIATATFRTTTQTEQNLLLWNICRCFIKEQLLQSMD